MIDSDLLHLPQVWNFSAATIFVLYGLGPLGFFYVLIDLYFDIFCGFLEDLARLVDHVVHVMFGKFELLG